MLKVKDTLVVMESVWGGYALLKSSPLSLKEFNEFMHHFFDVDYARAIMVVENYLHNFEAQAIKRLYQKGIESTMDKDEEVLANAMDYVLQYYILEPLQKELGIVHMEGIDLELEYLEFVEKVGTI